MVCAQRQILVILCQRYSKSLMILNAGHYCSGTVQETQPLRVIDLSEVTSVAYCDENLERSNMFK